MQRSTLIAVTVFGILVVAAGWVMTRKPERGIQRINFAGLQASLIDRIVVTGAHPVELKKDGAVWRLANGREADNDAVQALLNTALRVTSSDVLAQDANHSLDYDVDDAKGEHVQLFSVGTEMANFVVGKSMTGGAAVRAGDLVFRVANLAPTAFAHSPADWMQRRMFTERLEDLKRVNIQLAGAPAYTLVRNEKSWELAENENADLVPDPNAMPDFRFDPGAAQALAAAVVGLRASEILDADPGLEVTKLGPGADVFTFFMNDKALAAQAGSKEVSRTLRLGASREDKGLYAQVEGRKEVVLLPAYAAAALRKQRTDLRDLTIMLPFDVNQVQALTLNTGSGR